MFFKTGRDATTAAVRIERTIWTSRGTKHAPLG